MRREDRSRLRLSATLAAAVVLLAGVAIAQDAPRLTGSNPPMETTPAPPMARAIVDDVRKMRNYPEQPPVIPHAIEGYQLSLSTNRCLECHRRQFTEASGAPMISVTHFMDREGQILADVAPRRYFCLQCHVSQTDARPLVGNLFIDMIAIGGGN